MVEEHVAALAREARAVDDLRVAFQDGTEQRVEVLGVVLEIGVLNDHVVARGSLDTASHGGAFALIRV